MKHSIKQNILGLSKIYPAQISIAEPSIIILYASFARFWPHVFKWSVMYAWEFIVVTSEIEIHFV